MPRFTEYKMFSKFYQMCRTTFGKATVAFLMLFCSKARLAF